jgi:hypothetical protein
MNAEGDGMGYEWMQPYYKESPKVLSITLTPKKPIIFTGKQKSLDGLLKELKLTPQQFKEALTNMDNDANLRENLKSENIKKLLDQAGIVINSDISVQDYWQLISTARKRRMEELSLDDLDFDANNHLGDPMLKALYELNSPSSPAFIDVSASKGFNKFIEQIMGQLDDLMNGKDSEINWQIEDLLWQVLPKFFDALFIPKAHGFSGYEVVAYDPDIVKVNGIRDFGDNEAIDDFADYMES